MSESRGLTLRKKNKQKRPVIGAPQQQKPGAPTATNKTQLRPPKERSAPSETSDLIKRRYSTRYNQLPNFGNVPDVPALPGAGANNFKRRSHGSPSRPQSAHSANPLRVDQAALGDPDLQHEGYVTQLLANATESDIQEYQHNLNRVKRRNSMDMKQTIYQNRTQFIKISKEAESLKSEMSNLRVLMTELTSALELVNTTSGTSINGFDDTTRARKQANRSSVANLEAMWNTQLQALWKNVDKSQKYLPAVPGRHVIMENGAWIELDSATWKPRRPVHIVLLNDHLLVASKKRKKLDPNVPQSGPAPTKLVAEECWPLRDMEVIDMAASGQIRAGEDKTVAAAISIRSGGKTWTYKVQSKDLQIKADVVTQIRKAQEDLRKANLPTSEKRASRQDLNYFASHDPSSAINSEIIDGINSGKEKPEILVDVDGKQQNLRWVEGQIDELDIDIALQHSTVAVEKVEKLRSIAKASKNPVARELITIKIDERAMKLANVLCRELIDTPSFIEPTKRTTSILIRLGFEDRAREAYLAARGDTLTERQRQCVFDGDLHKYIFSISYVYFTIIKNTVLIFQASFPPATMSACIKWANEHLQIFNALLVRQLSAVEECGKTWKDCMDVVWAHEREMLGEHGLDFREVIGRNLAYRENARGGRPRSREQSRSKSRTRAT